MNDSDELTLAYMSIDTLQEKIKSLEFENTSLKKKIDRLITERYLPHGPSSGWSGDDTDTR